MHIEIDHGNSRKDWAIWGGFLCVFLIISGVILGFVKRCLEKRKKLAEEENAKLGNEKSAE